MVWLWWLILHMAAGVIIMSLMKKHQERALKAQREGKTLEKREAPYTPESAMKTLPNAQKRYMATLASVTEDCKRISNLNSRAERNSLKRDELIDKYADYIRDYRESGLNHSNEVLVHYIVWLLDIRSIEPALDLALFAIEQEQSMPERYNRDLKTFVADELFDWAEGLVRDGKSAEPYFSQVFELISSGLWHVHEAVQVKFYKLAGIWAEHESQLAQALALYEKAESIDHKLAKVKTKIATLKKQLEKSTDLKETI